MLRLTRMNYVRMVRMSLGGFPRPTVIFNQEPLPPDVVLRRLCNVLLADDMEDFDSIIVNTEFAGRSS